MARAYDEGYRREPYRGERGYEIHNTLHVNRVPAATNVGP